MGGKKRTDRSVLGWMITVGLLLSISSAAWALDLDQAIHAKDSDASEIMQTLGRGKKPNSQESRWKHKKKVYVQLIRKTRKHRVRV